MEEEEFDQVDANPRPGGVRISITRASFSEDEGGLELPEKNRPRADSDASIDEEEMNNMMKEDEERENEQLRNEDEGNNDGSSNGDLEKESRTEEDEEVSKAFENGVTLNEESGASNGVNESEKSNGNIDESVQNNDVEGSPEKSPAMEMIGDRVLIERDGKFELVDVNEIKAEYFDMLGISPEKDASENTDSEASGSVTSEVDDREKEDERPETRPRPKTTSVQELHRRTDKQKSARRVDKNRSQSAQVARRKNDEYANIKSIYAMTEQQLEIKRKREEAVARRRKEEEEREREERRRKREDAERAFQAWLLAKTEEAKEMQRQAKLNKPDPNVATEKAQAAQSAYNEWVQTKRKQGKAVRVMENSRRADEAAQYIIRDRELCDEAFKRWLKKKKEIARAKSAASKKKKPKLKRKEQPPHNSHKIRYYEYYGYRNNVVL